MKINLLPLELIFNPQNCPELDREYLRVQDRTLTTRGDGMRYNITRHAFTSDFNEVLSVGGVTYIPNGGYLVECVEIGLKGEPISVASRKIKHCASGMLWDVSNPLDGLNLIHKFRFSSGEFTQFVSNPEALVNYIAMHEDVLWNSIAFKNYIDVQPKGDQSIGAISSNMPSHLYRQDLKVNCDDGVIYNQPVKAIDHLRIFIASLDTLQGLRPSRQKMFTVRVKGEFTNHIHMVSFNQIMELAEAGTEFEIYSEEFNTLIKFVRRVDLECIKNIPCVLGHELESEEVNYLKGLFGPRMISVDQENLNPILEWDTNLIYSVRAVKQKRETIAGFLGLDVLGNSGIFDPYESTKVLIELMPNINLGDPIHEEEARRYYSGG